MTAGINPTLHVGYIQLISLGMDNLHHEIMDFCNRTGVAPTRLGMLALNDKAFVAQVAAGRRVWPETAAKVRAKMVELEAGRQAA